MLAEFHILAQNLRFPEGPTILPDVYATNLCFGGKDDRTAYITLSTTGQIVAASWPRPGLRARYS